MFFSNNEPNSFLFNYALSCYPLIVDTQDVDLNLKYLDRLIKNYANNIAQDEYLVDIPCTIIAWTMEKGNIFVYSYMAKHYSKRLNEFIHTYSSCIYRSVIKMLNNSKMLNT